MVAKTSTGVKAASGYPQYSGSLITPMFNQDLIEKFYCSTVFGEITTTDYLQGEISKCGDTVTFWREPCVVVRPHIKDGTIKHDTLESSPITLTIDKALEFSFKIAKVDEKQMCNWPSFRASALRSAARNSARAVDCCIINDIYADADKYNRGNRAGVCTQCYNLGAAGAPLVVDKDNVLDFMLALHSVLNEQCIPRENRWIVVPPKFENILLSSEFRESVCCSEMYKDIVLNGRLPGMIAGFAVYVSNAMETVIDPGVQTAAYNIIAGWKGSVAFASQIEDTREIQDRDDWSTFYQGLMVYGFGTMHPEGLVHAYVTLA